MGFARRTFLQKAGLASLTLWFEPTRVLGQKRVVSVDDYLLSLAQPTNRKLALLIGINQYPESTSLNGCVTDVELQKELLVYRFGFNPKDILTLTGQQATRKNIEEAFIKHLTKQAKAEDVAIFHFSGYGSQVKVPTGSTPDLDEGNYKLVNSLLPVDGLLSNQDLLMSRLMLLLRSLATDKVTTILDTSYAPSKKIRQGNLRVRSLKNRSTEIFNPEALSYPEELLPLLGPEKIKQLNQRGITFYAAKENQIAYEASWSGFEAGLFTIALTQYLWEITAPTKVIVTLEKTAQKIEQAIGYLQQPELKSQIKSATVETYYLNPNSECGQGVVSGIESNGLVEIELNGLPANVLENYGINSCFKAAASEEIYFQIASKSGLKAKARLVSKSSSLDVKVGLLLQEFVRILPRSLTLAVALDVGLERIERVDATSAFSSITYVSIATEQAADCILGRVQQTVDSDSTKYHAPSQGGYGLFSIAGVLIAKTAGVPNEAVKSAIGRLAPYLKTLYAAKLWHLTLNESSSKLKVKATLELITEKNKVLSEKATSAKAAEDKSATGNLSLKPISTVSAGTQIQYRLENFEDSPVYFIILGIYNNSQAYAVYCPQMLIAALGVTTIPSANSSFKWIVNGSANSVDITVIYSRTPLEKTFEVLSSIENVQLDSEQIINLVNPIEVSSALLQDLHNGSAVSSEITANLSDVYALDVNAWASLSFVYQVVQN